jgi:hypothetical protein
VRHVFDIRQAGPVLETLVAHRTGHKNTVSITRSTRSTGGNRRHTEGLPFITLLLHSSGSSPDPSRFPAGIDPACISSLKKSVKKQHLMSSSAFLARLMKKYTDSESLKEGW